MEFTKEDKLESDRLDQLQKYNILDSLTEKDYEDITRLASSICDVPIALISFVDKDRQWFKSHRGLDTTETLREHSFCAHAIKTPSQPFLIPDSRKDERFQTNPLVTGEPKIVFYGGFPLVNKEGFGLGTLCVIDTVERNLTDQQLDALEILSKQVMNLLELRRKNFESQVLQMNLENRNKDLEQFAMVLAHDIKSPLSNILLSNYMLRDEYANKLNEDAIALLNTGNKAAKRIQSLVDGLLSYYKNIASVYDSHVIELDPFFNSLKEIISSPKPYKIHHDGRNASININKTLFEQIFFNLVNNSIRYNDKPVTEISISFKEDATHYHFSVSDNGIGISSDRLINIFDLFTTVATADSFGMKGHGIGLATVKKIIGLYDGRINVTSELGSGTTFSFSMQKKAAT